MKRTLLLAAAAAAGLMIAGCADESYGHHVGYGYSYYGPSEVWYDGYYGPYSDGYWDSGAFFYRGNDGQYVRDGDGHFRQGTFEHAQRYKASPRRDDQHRSGDNDQRRDRPN